MEEMPSLNMPVQRLKVAILPLDLPCTGPVTHSREILTTGKSHGKKPDRLSLNDKGVEKVSRFEYASWNIRRLEEKEELHKILNENNIKVSVFTEVKRDCKERKRLNTSGVPGRGGGGVQPPPPEITKTLQNRANSTGL